MEISRQDKQIVKSAKTKEQLFKYLKSKLTEQEQLDFLVETKDYLHKRYCPWILDLVVYNGVDYYNLPAKRVPKHEPSVHIIYDCFDPDAFSLSILADFKKYVLKSMYKEEGSIYFELHNTPVCTRARLNSKLRSIIQNNKLWKPAQFTDIPLTEQQMDSFMNGYLPVYESQYSQYYIDGWFYIGRSGHWLKKFCFKKDPSDGLYHVVEYYTTPKLDDYDPYPDMVRYSHFS